VSVSVQEQKKVCIASGGKCAFPGCDIELVSYEAGPEGTIVGEIAHLVAEHRQGPRGRSGMTDEERNKANNLMLLCTLHHTVIDQNPHSYSVQVLRQMKADHEKRIAATTPQKPLGFINESLVEERVHSTMLSITQLPRFVYSARCDYTDRQREEVKKLICYVGLPQEELVPFILRESRLLAFHDLKRTDNPFVQVANPGDVLTIPLADFCSEPEGRRRLVNLLNSSIAKFGGRKSIRFDIAHRRYFFVPTKERVERTESYRTLNGRTDKRLVVWNPKKKNTGEGRSHWLHLAAGLAFHQLAPDQWGFSIRPERHITKDGVAPYNPKFVGRKVTRLKAKMFNHAYLGEVHFWRDFLSGGKPRFILSFGRQSVIIETELIAVPVKWAGVPEDNKDFINQRFDDDLFSFGEMMRATGEWNEEEEEDEGYIDEDE